MGAQFLKEKSPYSSIEDKIQHFHYQIKQLEDGTHSEYLKKVREIRDYYENRLLVAEVFKQYELEVADEEYEREKALAKQQFEAKGLELKECLLNDLQDKKKAYDHYRHNMDLASGGTSTSKAPEMRTPLRQIQSCWPYFRERWVNTFIWGTSLYCNYG